MRTCIGYNFNAEDVQDGDWSALYERRRRDSCFCAVLEDDTHYYALRDHLGVAQLYYRWSGERFRFSQQFSDLVQPGDALDPDGVRALLGLGTIRLVPLIRDIQIVPPGSVIALDKATGQVAIRYQYRVRPQHLPLSVHMDSLVDELDRLFRRAMERIVREDRVGLYLSGGIDSELLGIYLKQMGVSINAYTSATWGPTSSDLPYARRTAEILNVRQHHIHNLETAEYPCLFDRLDELYGQPHGTRTALGVAGLWFHTPIGEERQLFSGENNDSLNGALAAQYLTWFASYLPLALRKRRLPYKDAGKSFVYFTSQGYYDDISLLTTVSQYQAMSRLQKLILAAMYVSCISDSEVVALPAMRAGIIASDPYCDMDLVEFVMGVPLIQHIQVVRKKPPVVLAKKAFQRLLLRYVPTAERGYRKKAFTVSLERDEQSRMLYETRLPVKVEGIPLHGDEARFAGGTLLQWCQKRGIPCAFEMAASRAAAPLAT